MQKRLAFSGALLLGLLSLVGCKEATLGPELTGSIEGTVLDFKEGTPIAGASVTTSPPTSALVTGAQGTFAMEDLPAGNYTITASRTGYRTNTATISVRENRTTQAAVFLTEDATDTTDVKRTSMAVDILGFNNRTSNDSTFVRVEYRVRNTGTVPLKSYEVYFRIDTEGRAYYEERTGTNLGVGQADIAFFEKYLLRDRAVQVIAESYSFLE